MRNLNELSYKVFFQIFDTKVQPILMYSAELWGSQRLETVERVHLLACKQFLGVPRLTPNKIVYGDLGRYPMYIISYIRVLKYWFKLLSMPLDRLPRQAYDMLLGLDEKGKQCWASKVRNMLCSSGFGLVWLQQGVGDVKMFISVFRQRLCDMFIQEWSSTIENRDRYIQYRSIKTVFEPELFVTTLVKFQMRTVYAMLRAGMFPVNANLARYKNDENKKFCPFCEKILENELHLLYICPLYVHERNKFKLTNVTHNFDGNFTALLNKHDKKTVVSLSLFLQRTNTIRSRFMESLV